MHTMHCIDIEIYTVHTALHNIENIIYLVYGEKQPVYPLIGRERDKHSYEVWNYVTNEDDLWTVGNY